MAGSRRMGEWLQRLTLRHAHSLRGLVTVIAKKVAPFIIKRMLSERGYVPLFLDGTAIEVDGKNLEGAGAVYCGERALWLHAAFLGPMQVSSRLNPATCDAVGDWRKQLKKDVLPLIPRGTPVWVAGDNAYFRSEFMAEIEALGWAFSISVTDARVKDAIKRTIDEDAAWTPVPDDEDTELIETLHQPAKAPRRYRCIVLRRRGHSDDGDRGLFWECTIVITSNRRLSSTAALARHWQKQGLENGFKEPLREMNLRRPPTAKLAGNQVYCLCGLIAHLLLLYLQHTMLPASARGVGLRPLIRDVMRAVAKYTTSGRKRQLLFSKDNMRMDLLRAAMPAVDPLPSKALA